MKLSLPPKLSSTSSNFTQSRLTPPGKEERIEASCFLECSADTFSANGLL